MFYRYMIPLNIKLNQTIREANPLAKVVNGNDVVNGPLKLTLGLIQYQV